jgi:hypothetical protein
MGAVAALFGLPGGCFCQPWLLAELNRQLQQVRRELRCMLMTIVRSHVAA